MEIGSFIELELPENREWYCQEKNIARLNSGRAGIFHAFRLTGCKSIWLPYYLCPSVREFLKKYNVSVKFYHIDENFTPMDIEQNKGEAVLIVNYFGTVRREVLNAIISKYENVILDNSHSFFSEPVDNCYCVYSCRKFFGVPDGSYVVGKEAEALTDYYEQCHSSDTSAFLLERIEYGCAGKAYQDRMKNESRINNEGVMLMSKLTRTILDGIDYDVAIYKRSGNFNSARDFFGGENRLAVGSRQELCGIPMVYPLLIEKDGLQHALVSRGHYQSSWWSELIGIVPLNGFETMLCRHIVPVTIDQRYGYDDIERVYNIVDRYLSE